MPKIDVEPVAAIQGAIKAPRKSWKFIDIENAADEFIFVFRENNQTKTPPKSTTMTSLNLLMSDSSE